MQRHTKPYENVLALIGWTPLIRLNKVTRGIRTPVYGKAEFFNPGGSIKDRIGMPIIERAEKEGKLKPQIAGRFPLEQAAEAQELLASRKVTGKIVLVMGKKLKREP